jgi:hypothetical protein
MVVPAAFARTVPQNFQRQKLWLKIAASNQAGIGLVDCARISMTTRPPWM